MEDAWGGFEHMHAKFCAVAYMNSCALACVLQFLNMHTDL